MTKTISITSGKGGVGKTTLTCNLAYALALRGKRVLILDGDLGMANVDLFFGMRAEGNLLQVLKGERTIQEIVHTVTPNIDFVSGGSGITDFNHLNVFERRSLLNCLEPLELKYDYLLTDTAPGISENVLALNSACQKIGVVITPDPAALADAYALIKVLEKECKETHFSIIANMVRDEMEGLSLFQRFHDVVNRFLPVGLDYWGALPMDPLLRKSTQFQRLILKHEPQSDSAHKMIQISQKIEKACQLDEPKAGLQFFFEQMMGVA